MKRPVLAVMVLAVTLLASLSSTTALAQAAPPGTPIVFVFDGTGARVSGERVRRALTASLHRPVVRMGDAAAGETPAHLTIAFSAPDRWIVEYARGETHTTRTVILRSPTVARLARVVATIVVDTDPPTPSRAGPVAQRGDWIALVGDEILDPFTTRPPVTRARGRRTTYSPGAELVDPFGNPTSTWHSYDDVIDPWSR